jgi:hypothetical protein
MSLFEDDSIYFDPQTNRYRDRSNGNRFTASPGGTTNPSSTAQSPANSSGGGAVFSTALQRLAQGITGGGGVLTRALTGAGGVLVRAVSGIGSALIGAGGVLVRVISGLGSLVVGSIVGALTVGIGAMVAAFKLSTEAATTWAKSLSSLRANQGLSSAQGMGMASRNSLFGISPDQTAQMMSASNMNPMMARIRGSIGFGDPYNPNYYADAAPRYQRMAQSGEMGRMLANKMLDRDWGGQAPDAVRATLNLKPEQIQSQLAYGSRVQSQMGISPDILKRYSEEIPLTSQRLGYAVNMAKIKLAVELAPMVERVFGGLAVFVGKNAGNIAKGIERGAHFLMLVLPPMLMRGGAGILRGGAAILRGIGAFAGGLAGSVRPILGIFGVIINGVRTFAGALLQVASSVVKVVGIVWEGLKKTGIPGVAQEIGKRINGNANKTPEEKIANGITAGVALRAAAPLAIGIAGMALRGGRAASRGGTSLLARARFAGGSAIQFLRTTATGSLGTTTRAGVARALSVPVVAAGVAVGTAGYEAMRRYNVLGYRSMPSTAQIIGTYTGLTPSPTQQAASAAKTKTRTGADPFSMFSGALDEKRLALANYGDSNLEDNPTLQSTLSRLFNGVGTGANTGGDKLESLAAALDKKADGYSDEMKRIMAEIARNTGKTADNTKPLGSGMNPTRAQFDLVAAVSALIAQEGHQLQLRMP